MAAKVGLAAVSYGIGVQNRYSAFLDDEDGFGSPAAPAIVATGPKRADHAKTKTALSSQGSKSSSINNNGSTNLTAKLNGQRANNKADPHQKSVEQQKRQDAKRQRAGQQQQPGAIQATNNNGKHQANSKGNSNQETTAKNRSLRNQQPNSNNNHQSNVSHQLNSISKGNDGSQQQRKPTRPYNNVNNQRAGNRRQFFNDDKKATPANAVSAQHLTDDASANPFANVVGNQSNEEEKRRRQQKRALDLKHKDPEKREARRQQLAATEQSNATLNQADIAQGDIAQKGQRTRKQVVEGNRIQDDAAAVRGFKGPGLGGIRRGRRPEQVGSEQNEGERREGQQAGRTGPRQGGDRPQRNRNGFGAGSRGSRGSRGDDQGRFVRDSERQKPIPNFSDKLDFPSLAS